MSNKKVIALGNGHPLVRTAAALLAVFFVVWSAAVSHAAAVKVSPSSLKVKPGEGFYIDIIAEDIPAGGLGAVQFRLNLSATGTNIVSVADAAQGAAPDVSIASPLLMGPSAGGVSGIGSFFLAAAGQHGVIAIDNEPISNGSGLYTFGLTNGSTPPAGGGAVARFQLMVGKDVAADRMTISLTEVALLNDGFEYPLLSNTSATVELQCMATVPSLLGLSQPAAEAALLAAGLLTGRVYEIDNRQGKYELHKVLVQSLAAGTTALCGTPVDMAVNTPPVEVSGASAADKANDERGTVILSWLPSPSPDTAGYRIYVAGGPVPLKEISDPASTGAEVSGLPSGQTSQLRITAFDSFGNESQGLIVPAKPIDDVAPRIFITGVADGAYYPADVLPVVTVEDANLLTKEVTLNGGPYNGAAISIEGNYLLKVSAKDAEGNTSSREIGFVIDKTPPSIQVSGVAKGGAYNRDVAPVITVTDKNLQKSETLLNGVSYVSGTVISPEGRYELKITAIDKAGNQAGETVAFIIDKTRPVSAVEISEPRFEAGGRIYVSRASLFTLKGSDEGISPSGIDKVEYRTNSSSWNKYSLPFVLADVPEGAVSIDYRAVDLAGNVEDIRTQAVKLDNTPPVSAVSTDENLAEGVVNNVSAKTVFMLTAVDNMSGLKEIRYAIDGGGWKTYSSGFSLKGLDAGEHAISYKAVDNVLNEEKERTITVRLISLEVSKEAPVEQVVLAAAWYHEKDGDNGKHAGEDDKANKHKALLNIAATLASAGITYYIPRDEDDLRSVVRSGRFNTFVLMDFREESLGAELREMVNYGAGLVFIKTDPDEAEETGEIFGVKFKGESREKGLTINLVEGPLGPAGTLKTSSGDKVVRTGITSADALGLGFVMDKKETYPVIVSRRYGRGRAALFAFNLFNCPDQTRASELFLNAVGYVNPGKRDVSALDSIPVRIRIRASSKIALSITETLPDNTTAGEIAPEATLSGAAMVWQRSLEEKETATFRYQLNLPDAKGDYVMKTEVRYGNNGRFNSYGEYPLTITVPYGSKELFTEILAGLSGIPAASKKDSEHLKEAMEELSKIVPDPSGRKQADRNIGKILEAAEELRKVSVDVSDIRLKLDELLRIFQKKWFLLKSNE